MSAPAINKLINYISIEPSHSIAFEINSEEIFIHHAKIDFEANSSRIIFFKATQHGGGKLDQKVTLCGNIFLPLPRVAAVFILF
jgi:hypothetical protein